MMSDLNTEKQTTPEHIQAILDTLPSKPGCYLMKNETGVVIYVGKAINLRSRVRSYFQRLLDLDVKTRQLVQHIHDIEWIVVGSELEALILEMTLIKRHRPHYNIRLKDDKRYPYIKVHWASPFPKVTITRQMVEDGSRYFGPYTSSWAVHQTLDVLRRIFQYLSCDREITGQDKRACLYYDIKLCTAPCIGAIEKDAYRQTIDDLCRFLEGQTEEIINRLHLQMDAEAEKLNFEKAAAIRDYIQSIEKVVEKQKVVSTEKLDTDVIAMARADHDACVQIFFIRSGKLIGREYFVLEGADESADQEVISQFMMQFYSEAATVPPRVLLPNEIEEMKVIEQWMHTRRNGEKVELLVPREGTPQELVQMAAENAMETLTALRSQWQGDRHKQSEALALLQSSLNLAEPPNRIECFDISNVQGSSSVGSMVVFEQGVPNHKNYRRFNIKSVEGPDDFASMEEVLRRRFNRWVVANDPETRSLGTKIDISFSILPDLLVVDGGKGQLSRAIKIMDEFQLTDKICICGLAKQQEEIFLPGNSESILLPRNSPALFLLQRIRDEAHRFAITAHRNRREKIGLASRLEVIPGIGNKRRIALLSQFGSIDKIRSATLEELSSVPGMNMKAAQAIKNGLE